MSRPWEETWEPIHGSWPFEVHCASREYVDRRVAEVWTNHEDTDLLAAAPEMARMLLKLHLEKIAGGWRLESDREIEQLLRKAGVIS